MADEETWEDLAKRLTALVVKLDERNERLDTWIAGQGGINDRLTAAIERLDVTQARIETLLARMLPQSENGRDA
jgi:transcriptional accessory protein Tex/SPT6